MALSPQRTRRTRGNGELAIPPLRRHVRLALPIELLALPNRGGEGLGCTERQRRRRDRNRAIELTGRGQRRGQQVQRRRVVPSGEIRRTLRQTDRLIRIAERRIPGGRKDVSAVAKL